MKMIIRINNEAKAVKSLLFNSWRSNSIKTMFEGLDARIKWMEKFES